MVVNPTPTPTPQSGGPKKPYKAQQIINFKRGVQYLLNTGQIDKHEFEELTQLIEDGHGYPNMLKDFMEGYKAKDESVEKFAAGVRAKDA